MIYREDVEKKLNDIIEELRYKDISVEAEKDTRTQTFLVFLIKSDGKRKRVRLSKELLEDIDRQEELKEIIKRTIAYGKWK